MCQHCDQMREHTEKMGKYIASLCDNLMIASSSDWETSEPMTIGGPAGSYRLRSPFDKTYGIQWRIDSASAGGGSNAAIVVVGSDTNIIAPGFVSGDTPLQELNPIRGYVALVPANNTIPCTSEWYTLNDSQQTLFLVIAGTTSAAYATIKFRVKR